MLPDRVSNPGPLTYESGALPIALRGPATDTNWTRQYRIKFNKNPLLLYMYARNTLIMTHNYCKISLLSVHVKLFTKLTRLRANNLSRLTVGSYDNNESSATVSDHVI